MRYTDEDINFEVLDWQRFEELCFDLLLKYQFYNLTWNRGGSDDGRDIEARFGVANPLTGFYEEQWYVECKHHSRNITKAALSEKFAQARVEPLDHFLIITSKYLSKGTKKWINEMEPKLAFRVHILDSKNLKKKLLEFPELVAAYFADDTTRLVKSLYKLWLYNDALPDIHTLLRLSTTADPERLTVAEMVFLIYALGKLDYEFTEADDDNGLPEFDFDLLVPFIARQPTGPFPVLSPEERERHHVKYFLGHSFQSWPVWTGNGINSHFYHDIRPYEGGMLEMYFERDIHRRMDVRVGVYAAPEKQD
ncbi:MAG: restriction endonuclease [Chitinophagaceae bacterium]|nr:MAG: restriction endonuclease [Chitinophagaceae bacterium]